MKSYRYYLVVKSRQADAYNWWSRQKEYQVPFMLSKPFVVWASLFSPRRNKALLMNTIIFYKLVGLSPASEFIFVIRCVHIEHTSLWTAPCSQTVYDEGVLLPPFTISWKRHVYHSAICQYIRLHYDRHLRETNEVDGVNVWVGEWAWFYYTLENSSAKDWHRYVRPSFCILCGGHK